MAAQTLYLGTVLTAGLLSFFSPCIVPLLPVYISVFSAGSGAAQEDIFQRRIRTLFKSCLFVAGISTCFIILGFGAGALGSIIGSSFFMIAILCQIISDQSLCLQTIENIIFRRGL